MKKSTNKFYILLTVIAASLWFVGSWWHYTCNIKNTCGSNSEETFAANPKTETKPDKKVNITSNQVIDTDSDGLSDEEEKILGTDPLLLDTDEDSIPDNEEVGASVESPLDTDSDGIIDALDKDDDNDGIQTSIEEKIGTSSLRQDTDDDGINDFKEIGKNTKEPIDTDLDGIINALDADDDDDSISTSNEILLGTNSLLLDTDGDGISDAKEIGENLDQPIDTDKDGIIDAIDTEEETDQDNDGLSDSLEAKLNTNPKKADSDDDGISDSEEIGGNIDAPLDSDLDGIIDAIDAIDDTDSDNDSISDAIEKKLGSDPEKADSDNDGINDNEEIGKNINEPLDTDSDGILNVIDKDDDNDKLITRYEIRIGTNPLSDDTDSDGLKDNDEVRSPDSNDLQDTDADKLINPVDPDDDNDGIPTSTEITHGTNPLKIDSDDDGKPDAEEYGSNIDEPLDSDGNGTIDALQDDKSDSVKVVVSDDTTDSDTQDMTKGLATVNDIKKDEAKEKVETDTTNTNASKEQKIVEAEVDSKSLNIEYIDSTTKADIKSARLYFPFYSAKPKYSEDAIKYFDEIAAWMTKSPENTITLTGHTDNIGSEKANLALGIKRVMVIREFLLNKGAPIAQIDIMSRGESDPIKDNKTEKGRLMNRRVEIVPLQKI
ncbi:OmpA family protein [uncultured Cocleimonas sp.]|uniref:OmpA family protein n=1 Tax=uncultured Cocleimonas sp. TaxID=1051587 RepID=UPI00262FFE24|nr:OmpA family protein [uncultured Cocleimonas sp.]